MPSDAIWNDVFLFFEMLRKKCATRRYILTKFKLMFWKLEVLNKMKAKTSTGAFRHYLNRCFFKLELLRHLLNSMTLISAVWRNLKRRFGSWNNESRDANWCISTLFEPMFLFLFFNIEQLRKEMTNKQGRFMVHSDAIWIHLLEVEKTLKAKTPTGNFWHYLKRFFVKFEMLRKN